MPDSKPRLELLVSLVQLISIVSGVVLSVLSFNDAREKEAEARIKEAESRKIEAARPFDELRRNVYLEAVKTAAIIANPDGRSVQEMAKAKRRFRELYVAELTMVEEIAVEEGMVNLATAVDPDLIKLTDAQTAALNLAKALRASYATTYPVERK